MDSFTFNQIQYTILAALSLIVSITGLYLTVSIYRSTKSRPLFLLVAIHLLLVPFYLFHISLYFINQIDEILTIFLYRWSVIILTIICFLLVLFIEFLRSEKPSTIIVMIVTFGTGISILLDILPDTFLWDFEIGPYFADFPRTIYAIELIILTLVVLYQISKFLPYIPKDYKNIALLFFSGCIIPILGPGILIATKITLLIWGTEIFVLAVGVLIVIIAIICDNRVLRILPFNVYRLSVMNMNIGLSIFDVLFETKKKGPDVNILIPHLMTANLLFVQSVIDQSERIQQIKTDNYVFIFEAVGNIVTFIIADKTSLLLRSALREFTKQFLEEFREDLNSILISKYSKAELFIKRNFSFLPNHKIISISS